MRDIKFRAWRKCEMYEGLCIEKLLAIAAKTGFGDSAISPVIWMQYTGLKDRNGVEIYEGDIVKWGHIDGFIEMSGARVAVVDMSNSCDGLTFDAFKPIAHRFKIGNFMYRKSTEKCMEVIGNIHQNPELLEGKK